MANQLIELVGEFGTQPLGGAYSSSGSRQSYSWGNGGNPGKPFSGTIIPLTEEGDAGATLRRVTLTRTLDAHGDVTSYALQLAMGGVGNFTDQFLEFGRIELRQQAVNDGASTFLTILGSAINSARRAAFDPDSYVYAGFDALFEAGQSDPLNFETIPGSLFVGFDDGEFERGIDNEIVRLRSDETHDFNTFGIGGSDLRRLVWSITSGPGVIGYRTGIYAPPLFLSRNVTPVTVEVGVENENDPTKIVNFGETDFEVALVETGVRQLAYMIAEEKPDLPNPVNQREEADPPEGWTEIVPPFDPDTDTYRIGRDITTVAGEFAEGETDWEFDPEEQPFVDLATGVNRQRRRYAYQVATTIAEGDLPTEVTEEYPAGWTELADDSTETMGVWRISSIVTEDLEGAFIEAGKWRWDPAYRFQPWIPAGNAPDSASDQLRRFITTIRHKDTGARAQVIWSVQSDPGLGVNGEPGKSAISTIFAVTLIASDSPNTGGQISVGPSGDIIETITPGNFGTIRELHIGLSADTQALTSRLRGYLPQLAAGDILSIYEDRVDNWADFLVDAIPASISGSDRTVSYEVLPLEHGKALDITAAASMGFSRAEKGADGSTGSPRKLALYIADKTDTTLTIGSPQPTDPPDSITLILKSGATFTVVESTVNPTDAVDGWTHQFTDLDPDTAYRAEAYGTYSGTNGPTDYLRTFTSKTPSEGGMGAAAGVYEVVAASPTAVRAKVPAATGTSPSYEWRWDYGRSPDVLIWRAGPTTTTNEATLEGLSDNAIVNVQCRTTVGGPGNRTNQGWVDVGTAQTLESPEAPEPATSVTLTFATDGRGTVRWGPPGSTTHPITRYGVTIWLGGLAVARLGTEDENDRSATSEPLPLSGQYAARVIAISEDDNNVRHRADAAWSDAAEHAGLALAVVDNTPFTVT